MRRAVTAGAVRLNTGTGFTGAIAWPGGHGKIAEDKHISLGGGAYFTYCIPLVPPFVVARLCFNPGVNASTSMGRPEVSFRDMDGDSYSDQVLSVRDSELTVTLNPIDHQALLVLNDQTTAENLCAYPFFQRHRFCTARFLLLHCSS